MRYDAIPCSTMQHHVVLCNTVQCHAVPCNTMQYHAKPCNEMQYHAIPCYTMQYHAIPCIFNTCWRSVPLPCGQYKAIFAFIMYAILSYIVIRCWIMDSRAKVFRAHIVSWGVLELRGESALSSCLWTCWTSFLQFDYHQFVNIVRTECVFGR